MSYVDTYAMDKMNMYDVWRQIKWELMMHRGNRAPYILTIGESKYLESYLTDHTATNSVEEVLNDIYDFSPTGFAKYKTCELTTTITESSSSVTEICDYVQLHTKTNISMKAMRHALTSMLKHSCPSIRTSGKVIKGGHHVLRRQHRYFMPSPRIETEALADLE